MSKSSGAIRQALPAYRRALLNRINDANQLLDSQIDYSNPSACIDYVEKLTAIQASLTSSVQKINEHDQRWQEILGSITDDDLLKKEQEAYDKTAVDEKSGYLSLCDSADTVLSRVYARISRCSNPTATTNPTQSSTNVPAASQQSGSTNPRPAMVHLPKINLPTFDGDILKFPEFWSIFKATVDCRTDLPAVTKMSYLLPLLKGTAEQAVKGYQLTDENYTLIVNRLHERFHRTDDRFISLLHAELKKVPCSSGKASEKRKTLDACERIFRLMEQAGETLDPGKSLVFDLLGKFPGGMIRDLDKYYKVGVYSTLSEVRQMLEKSITDEELTNGFLQDLNSTRQQNGKRDENKSGSSMNRYHDVHQDAVTDTTLTTGAQSQRPESATRNTAPPPSSCYFCDGKHYNAQCPKYYTAYYRRKRLQTIGRCTKCLRKHTSECKKTDVYCPHCQKQNDHHPILCYTKYPSQKSSEKSEGTGQSKQKNVWTPKKQSGEKAHVTIAQQNSDTSDEATSNDITQSVAEMVNFSHACTRNSLFQTAKVTAVNLATGEQHPVRLCLDTLSNRSYITHDTVQTLNLQLNANDTLYVSVFGSNKRVEIPSGVVSFGLRTSDGKILEFEANTTKLITNSPVLPEEWPAEEERLLRSWQGCLADDPFDSKKTIDILIGADYAWDIITGMKTSLQGCNIHLIPSVFGFMLGGQLQYEASASTEVSMLLISESACTHPHELGLVAAESKHLPRYPDVDEFWNLESIGIKECPKVRDDEVAQQAFDETVKYIEGRYHVKWPWIAEKREALPTNFEVARNRLESLTKRFDRDPILLDGYRDIIRQQTETGIIERVPDSELTVDHPVHYLPHHPVVKKSSATTKLRIVYDASSKARKFDASLNECLHRGPIILPDLVHLLLRFRAKQTAVISDVEKAFLQVALQSEDRDVTRFLWYVDDVNPSMESENLAVYRFRRVAFGIISSPFLLGATIIHHLNRENTNFAHSLAKDIYVDNVVSGLPVSQSPIEYFREIKDIFSRAGMNIQQFCSNSDELMLQIPERDRTNSRQVKVLGMLWNSQSDSDVLSVIRPSKWENFGIASKRGVLQCLASIFDPLGLFQPATFPAKVFLQNLWIQEFDWDDPLPDDLLKSWQLLRTSLSHIFSCEIPRFVSDVDTDVSLIVFGDASARGYGASVYLRRHTTTGCQTNLILAKSKLAPIERGRKRTKQKTVTLPRLELLAATVAAQLAKFCRLGFRKLDLPVHLFTDSECVLKWIYSTKKLERFVQRRVEKIRELTNCRFHYVGTKDNPADLLTRGTTVLELQTNDLWWHGPSWLNKNAENWPKTSIQSLTSDEVRELKPETRIDTDATLATIASPSSKTGPLGIAFHRFSSLQRLLRVSWLCLKMLKLKIWERLGNDVKNGHPELKNLFDTIGNLYNPDSHNAVLRIFVRAVQRDLFHEEISALRNGLKTSLARQLNLFVDSEGILRTVSRFQNADLPQTSRMPALLPKNHEFSRLVVLDAHYRLKHAGVSNVLSEIRQRFWIPCGRMFVKKMIKPCVVCRRFKKTEPFALPKMPPWPAERVNRSAPFQYVGVDYFGPLKISIYQTQPAKMWVALFTCLSTRAVHLEPVVDQTPAEFLKALIRFVSRRGCPQQMISDNGAQFRLTKLLGDRAWTETHPDENILSYCAQQGVEWKFIIELAPWQGGHYERLVGVVKSVLKTAVGRRLISWTDLVTLLTEIEAIVNSRPITYVPSDIDSSYRVLRPVDFLLYRPYNAIPHASPNYPVRDLGEGGRQLAAVWKSRERYLNKLWSLWYNEYILSLRERASMYHRSGRMRVNRTPIVGEVVIVRDQDLPRGSWKLARVTALIYSSDSQIRAAEVQFSNGVKLRRAVNFLIPLEVTGSSTSDHRATDDVDDNSTAARPQTNDFLTGDTTDAEDQPQQLNDTTDAFYGFTQDDVDRAANMLRLYGDDANDSQ